MIDEQLRYMRADYEKRLYETEIASDMRLAVLSAEIATLKALLNQSKACLQLAAPQLRPNSFAWIRARDTIAAIATLTTSTEESSHVTA